jgi:hypothetical protein
MNDATLSIEWRLAFKVNQSCGKDSPLLAAKLKKTSMILRLLAMRNSIETAIASISGFDKSVQNLLY